MLLPILDRNLKSASERTLTHGCLWQGGKTLLPVLDMNFKYAVEITLTQVSYDCGAALVILILL